MLIRPDSKFIEWILERKKRGIAAGIIALIAPLVALAFFIYLQVTSQFRQIVMSENETLLNLATYHLEEQIGDDLKAAKAYADRPLLIAALRKESPDELMIHLRNFIDNSNTIEQVIVTTRNGTGVAAYPADRPVKGLDFSGTDWYKGVSARWEPYISDFFLRRVEPKRYLFAMAVPVRDQTGDVLGTLVLHPKVDYFKDIMGGMSLGNGFVYIVDKNGNLIYHPRYVNDRIYDMSRNPAVAGVKKGLTGTIENVDPSGGEQVMTAFRPMKWGWGVIMQRPESEVFQPVKSVIIGLLVFAGVAILFGVVISYDGMELLYSIKSLSVRLREREQNEREMNAKLQSELAERKFAEQKLARTLVDLERSNKELEQFAYVASHDLQEPLRKVGSFTELLERKYKNRLDTDADRYMGYIVDGAKRMSMLINDLLTFSRIGTSTERFARTDCKAVLKRTLDDLQFRIRESGAVVTSDDLPVITADETQIGLLFQNLIGNGLKFRGDQPPRIHVSARREGEGWLFSVRDNGIGIESDYFDRIFVMFQRLHAREQYPGTGIGLAICKKIVERHGGRIWVESEFGKGAAFYFRIPDNGKEVNQA